MKNQNNFRPTQNEINQVSQRARRDAVKGSIAGGVLGGITGRKYKKTIIGTAVGAVAGDVLGRSAGRRAASRDVIESRKALLQNNLAELQELVTQLTARAEQRDFDREGNDFPSAFPQPKMPMRKSVRGMRSVTGNGVSAEAVFFQLRKDLTAHYGWAITSALSDEDLSAENCERLRNQVLGRQSKAAGPHASTQNDPEFERHFLASKIGDKAVSEMPDTLVHCNFLAAVRRGDLVEFGYSPDTTDFAIINRERTAEGTFAPTDATNPAAVARAYGPDRRTGRTPETVGALGAAAGLAGALAHLAGKKGRRPRLPLGVPRLTAGSSTNSATAFAMTSAPGPGTFPIRRAKLRGKKPPTNVHPRHLGKVKPKNFAFLIADNDPAFRLDPVKPTRLVPGTKQRVPMAKTRSEVLRRLRGMTQLSIGSAVAEGALDAVGLVGATPGKKKKLTVDSRGNVLAPPQRLTDPGTTSTSSFASALRRLHEFGIGSSITSGAGRFFPEIGAIAAGDTIGESVHDRLKAAHDKKKRRLMRQRGGVEPLPGMGTATGTMTTMSAVHDTLNEFAVGRERMDKARRDGTTVASAGAGGVAGALAGAYHDQGKPVRVRDLRPGDQVYRRQGIGGIYQHTGVVDEDGKVVHRTRGSSVARSVKPESFVKGGRGPLRRESHSNDLPRAQAARNATRASGQRQGKYSIAGENCHTASTRIASKSAPHSRQLRKVIGGAAIGAASAGAMAHILQNHKKKDQ